MKKMARNEDAFTQRFEQQKGSGLVFFFEKRKKKKKVSPNPFHANMVRKVYTVKISGPYQLFFGPDPFFPVV